MSDVTWINLALQGGGSHGALTWGVLDRILEDEQLKIGDITITVLSTSDRVVEEVRVRVARKK